MNYSECAWRGSRTFELQAYSPELPVGRLALVLLTGRVRTVRGHRPLLDPERFPRCASFLRSGGALVPADLAEARLQRLREPPPLPGSVTAR